MENKTDVGFAAISPDGVPDGWGANNIVHVVFKVDPNGKMYRAFRHVTSGGYVGHYLDLCRGSATDLFTKYPPDDFRTPAEPGFEYLNPRIDIPVRGPSYVIIELDKDNTKLRFHSQNPGILTSDNALHSGLRYVNIEANPVTIQRDPFAGCRMIYFATVGGMPELSHCKTQLVFASGGLAVYPDEVDPDVPNDGGKPYPLFDL